MIRSILKLKPWLPEVFWRMCSSWAWKRFWAEEENEQRALLGENIPGIAKSERAVLVERISSCYPFSSLLEVGCAYGQSFHILGKLFPEVKMQGIDIDGKAAAEGQELLRTAGFSNIKLSQGNALDLSAFPDKSIDVVFTAAVLLYVDSDSVYQAVSEMLRVARSAVLLLEQHLEGEEDSGGLGVYVERESQAGGYWLRNYQTLFEQTAIGNKPLVTKVANPVWEAEKWKELGAVIEMRL